MQFENLVMGKFNFLAVKSLEIVMENPGQIYPVLVIQGGSGSGKTHLLKTIRSNISKDQTFKYSSCHTLMNDMIQAMRDQTYTEFKRTLESPDFLLIDNFQELQNRTGTQDMFHQILQNRVENKKQSIITSLTSFKNIDGISDYLNAYMHRSLAVEILTPDLNERTSITNHIAKLRGLNIDIETARFVAESCLDHLWEIEGCILKLEATSKILDESINLDFAKVHLGVKGVQENAIVEKDFQDM